jgi:hypothetical protein
VKQRVGRGELLLALHEAHHDETLLLAALARPESDGAIRL